MFSRLKTAITDRTNRHSRNGADELEDYKKEPDDLLGYSESSGSEMAKEQVMESDSSRRDSLGSLDSFDDIVVVANPNRSDTLDQDVEPDRDSKSWAFNQYGTHLDCVALLCLKIIMRGAHG